jgi:hypothetical protein
MHTQYKIVPTPARENTKQMDKVPTVSDIYHISLLTVHVGYVTEVNESRGGGKRIQKFHVMTCTALKTSTYSECIVFKLKSMLRERN